MRIPARWCGPPGSANGGMTCGLLAPHVDAPVVEVTLRRPPPLERELRVEDGALYDGELLVASAEPGDVELEAPDPVGLEAARAAEAGYVGLGAHPFPGCFVCGPEHPDGMGLRPGPVAGGVACPWVPDGDDPVLLWGALDCPGGWTTDLPGRPMVLGRMALRAARPVVPGEPHVVQGWTVGVSGRKTTTGTALYASTGDLLAVARATWIATA